MSSSPLDNQSATNTISELDQRFATNTISELDQQSATILESITDAFFALDRSWRFVYLNKQSEPLLQKTREELLGRNIWEAFPEAVASTFDQQYHLAMQTGNAVYFEEFYPPLDTWFQVNAYPSQDRLLVYFSNINARKKAEQERDKLLRELQETNALLDTLFNQAPVGFGFWDRDLRYVRVNNALAEINGLSAEAHVGKTVAELLPRIEPGVMEAFRQVVEQGKPIIGQEASGETPAAPGKLRSWSVSYYPIRLQDQIVGVGAICEEITVRKQIEDERKQSLQREQAARMEAEGARRRLELAQQAANIGTFEWDITKDHIAWTPELEALYGLPPGAFEGKYENWAQRVHPNDLKRVEEGIQVAIAGGAALNAEFRVTQPDGSLRWLLTRGELYRNDEQGTLRMIGINMDITERKELERRKDDFISMASHELKTPVTSIKGFTQVLLKRFKKQGDKETLRFLNIMDAQLNKLTKLVSDLLDVSKMQSGKLTYREEYFDLDELVRETIENIEATITTHQIQIEGVTHVQVFGDRDRVGQVLTNLVTNAIKYSPQANSIRVYVKSEPEKVVVSVQDFGIGIAEVHRDKIFEQFYQVTDPEEKTYPGLGIGLYLSNEIVKRHHGQMWLESVKDVGSVFSFSLPVARNDEKFPAALSEKEM